MPAPDARRSSAVAAPAAAPPRAPAGVAREPDWPRAVEECRRLLSELIAIDTSNPPGRELDALRCLEALLAREGIGSRTFEVAPGRGNLVARLEGSSRRRPLLLMGHVDVVGVERATWSGDPFRMEERDGFLYGRGVIDDKGMVAAEAMTLILLRRLGVPLERDVVLLAACDEESGGGLGVVRMLERHREEIDAEYAINEGGRTELEGGRVAWIGVQNAEKRAVNYTLAASGVAGHASMPRADNCIVSLARAIVRVTEPPFPVALTPTTRDDLMLNAMLRSTVSPTIVNGGFRANVIPAGAEVTLNCRLLPGTDPEEFRRALEARVGDPAVRVSFTPAKRPGAPSMPFEGPVVDAVRAVAARLMPGTPVVPLLSSGATDSAQLRGAGIKAYGLLPFPLTPGDAARMHGNDERMPAGSLETGLRFLYGVTAAVAGP